MIQSILAGFILFFSSALYGVSVPARGLKVIHKTCRIIEISWNRGNGQLCMVTCRKEGKPVSFPNNGWQYFPDFRYGYGTDLGDENYCIFQGLDSSVQVKNLDENTSYIIEVFEFDYNPFIYLNSNPASITERTHSFSANIKTSILDSCKKRNQVNFSAASSGSFPITEIHWEFPWKTVTGTNITEHLELSGNNTYNFRALPDMGCSDQNIRGQIYIIPGADSVDIITETAVCSGEPELFTSNIYFGIVPKTGYTRIWKFENGTESNLLRLYRTHKTAGDYSISLIIKSLVNDKFTGCMDTFSRHYQVMEATPLNLGSDSCFTRGSFIKLSSPVIASAYLWDKQGRNRNYFVSDTGFHSLTITDSRGCHTTDSVHISYCASNGVVDPFIENPFLFSAESQLLRWKFNSGIIPFKLFNVKGQEVHIPSETSATEGMINLNSGIYFVKVEGYLPLKLLVP